jgi:hypothetical protein
MNERMNKYTPGPGRYVDNQDLQGPRQPERICPGVGLGMATKVLRPCSPRQPDEAAAIDQQYLPEDPWESSHDPLTKSVFKAS